jgi:MSHA pilin protein MshD
MSRRTDIAHHRSGTLLAVRAGMNKARGVSLVELIVFIGIISVGLAGILGVMNLTTRASAQPLPQKQALAIAEAYLEEVLAAPFTYCDPDDANAGTAESTAAVNPADPTRCAVTLEAIGAEGETRGSTTTPYDNVNDYGSLAAGAPETADNPGVPITGLEAYTVAVAVVAEGLTAGGVPVAAADANARPQSLRVTVTVTGPSDVVVRLDGYRTRYAPNALP